ncbi:hypothetical protein PIB30_089993 [Stylosanthes scabra]|uniref:Uncharacterized protein n=1 Tax=Stylosanthes scabra TaxID=79078 RepID=A0ABU6QU38_9FABA|nr:hypothetical protein [Stylosanthes scabra]
MESTRRRVEPIRFWTKPKSDFLNRFVVLVSRLELLDLENFENLQVERVDSVSRGIDSKPLSRLKQNLNYRANDSAYGDSRPSGVVSACGVLISTWGSSRGASCQRPGYQPSEEKIINDRGRLIGPPGKYERWLSGASTGSVDVRVKRGALVPYWEPHEIVVLTPLLLKYLDAGDTLSSTGSGLSWVVEAWGVTKRIRARGRE